MLMKYRWRLLAMAIAGLCAQAKADETAIAFDDSLITIGVSGRATFGWQFSILSDIRVSAVGMYDFYHGDGLAADHPLAIWDISNPSQPLVSAVIPAGNSARLVNDFRYVDVTPVILPGLHEYAIGVLLRTDDFAAAGSSAPNWQLLKGAGLQFDGYRYGGLQSTMLSFPDHFVAGEQDAFGPNFTYSVIPEPAVTALSLVGAVAGCVYRRSRDRFMPSRCRAWASSIS
jgi:hypothetical protein